MELINTLVGARMVFPKEIANRIHYIFTNTLFDAKILQVEGGTVYIYQTERGVIYKNEKEFENEPQ